MLGTSYTLLLDFLARAWAGKVSEKIKKILMRVRKPIDDLIAKVMAWMKKKLNSFGKNKKAPSSTNVSPLCLFIVEGSGFYVFAKARKNIERQKHSLELTTWDTSKDACTIGELTPTNKAQFKQI